MKCQIVGQHLRIMSKAMRLLSKIGETVLITSNSEGMKLEAYSKSKTAFVEIKFHNRFFHTFECADQSLFRLSLRGLVLVFRILNIDKTVDLCTLTMDETLPRVIFFMKCKKGVTREYFLPYMEANVHRFSWRHENNSPTLTAHSRFLSESLRNFSLMTKIISLWLKSDEILFKSFFEEDELEENDYPITSFAYKSYEFLTYNVTEESFYTFPIKEIKSFLDFSSYQNQVVSVYFDETARPIELTMKNIGENYTGKMMLATFDIPEEERPQPPSTLDASASFNFHSSYDSGEHQLSQIPQQSIPIASNSNSIQISNDVNIPSFTADSDNVFHSQNIVQNSMNQNISAENVGNNQNTDDVQVFFDDDHEIFSQLLEELPEFSNHVSESQVRPHTTDLTGSQLERYKRKFLFGHDEADDYVPTSQDIIVPDSDPESD